jgi:hypothetical protein
LLDYVFITAPCPYKRERVRRTDATEHLLERIDIEYLADAFVGRQSSVEAALGAYTEGIEPVFFKNMSVTGPALYPNVVLDGLALLLGGL